MLRLCRCVQLVPSIGAELSIIDYISVCVGPRFSTSSLAVHLFTDPLSTGVNSLHCVTASFLIYEWKWMSEHVVEECGEEGLQLFMFSVWMSCTSMH